MALLVLILQIILLFCQIEAESSGLRYCANECGNVSIIYPFGIGDESCYLDKSFEVTCNYSSATGSLQAYLPSTKNLELLNVSSSDGTIRVNLPVISLLKTSKAIDLLESPFMFSQSPNRFAAIGCDEYGTIYPYNNSARLRRCLSICTCDPKNTTGCFDFLCDLPVIEKLFNATAVPYYSQIISKTCRSVSIVAEDWIGSEYMTNPSVLIDRLGDHMPAFLDWGKVKGNCYVDLTTTSNPKPMFCNKNGDCSVALTSSYICRCNIKYDRRELCSGTLICKGDSDCSVCPDGYDYRVNGSMCDQTIYYLNRKSRVRYVIIGCSCGLGLLLLLAGLWWFYKFMRRRREIRLKHMFFKRNGGFLLQQELSSDEGSIEKTKLFTSQDLEKATDNYNANRILGQGGQGTVYKGMLTDGRIVAVKKSKLVDESNLEHFINELAILSQINHRNIVQLLGCCLETEVPMLVYQFIPNGTLNQYLHDKGQEFPITWEMLLRIAVEVSGALFYLHSAASIPIYHRDIKSANILLDEKYHAKVSDFGTSKFITADQTHLTTKVQGTFGYLDPEFFQSSQYTEKSDVYSFGVVLVEILTGQKPFLEINSLGGGSLVGYFLQAMNENRLYEVIDARVLKEAEKEEIMTVATLARRCLNLNGKKRPTMKEVAFELGMIRASVGAPILQQNWEGIDFAGGDFAWMLF